MYVTVNDVTPDGIAVATVWDDGTSNNATVAFKAVEGKAKFTVSTYKTCPWAKVFIGTKAKGNISGVVKTNNGAPVLYPNKAMDVIAFANTGDPVIEKVTPSALSWKGEEKSEKAITVTGTNITEVCVSCNNPHFEVSVNGLVVKVTPVAENNLREEVKGTLLVSVHGSNSVEVPLVHEAAAVTYLNEPFSTSIGKFTIENVNIGGLSYVWKWDANKYMKASAFVGGSNNAAESMIVSPEVDLTGSKNATLTFAHALNFIKTGKKEEHIFVLAKKVGDENWTELQITTFPSGSSWTFVDCSMDLSAYDNSKIQIAFKYVSTTAVAPTWEVKNVKISGK